MAPPELLQSRDGDALCPQLAAVLSPGEMPESIMRSAASWALDQIDLDIPRPGLLRSVAAAFADIMLPQSSNRWSPQPCL